MLWRLALAALAACAVVTTAPLPIHAANIEGLREIVHASAEAPEPVVEEPIAVPATLPKRLTHPSVVTVSLTRSATSNTKAIARARAGDANYIHLLAAQKHAAQIQAAERRMRTMAIGDPIPFEGCPFADFTVPTEIGGQTFQLLIDTGSSSLALAGDQCANCNGVTPLWTATSASVDQGRTASGRYGDNSGWTGSIWRDVVKLVGASGQDASPSTTMRIVVITSQSTDGRNADGTSNSDAGPFFLNDPCADHTAAQRMEMSNEGILGLGFQSLAATGTDSFMSLMFNQNPSLPKQFAMQMCESSGALWIGGSDAAAYGNAPVQYTPLISNPKYWSVTPKTMYVDGVDTGFTVATWAALPASQGTQINIIDSGTTLWELPQEVYTKVKNAILAHPAFQKYFRSAPTNNFFDQPSATCERPAGSPSYTTLQAQLPTITLEFGNGLQLTMDGVGSYLLPCSNSYSQYTTGIAGGSIGMIAGWPLMNQFVTVHDVQNLRIGFAVSKTCTTGKIPTRAAVTTGAANPGAPTDGNNNGGDGTTTGNNGGGVTDPTPIDTGSTGHNAASSLAAPLASMAAFVAAFTIALASVAF